MAKIEKLEIVKGNRHCQFSDIENKLAAIYRNQRRIYYLLEIIAGLIRAHLTFVDPVILPEERTWDYEDEMEDL